MTLTSSTPKIVYTGNGTTGPFTFPFTVFESDSSDLVVEKYTIATGATTTMTITTDYTVSVSSYPGSGSITLVSSLSSAYKLIIRRSLEMSQETDLQPNDDLPANTIETMVDKAVAMVQQVKEVADRGLVQDVTQSTQITFPGASANKYIGWDSTGTALENKDEPTVTETSYNGTISHGLDASKAASPVAGDIYFATDTNILYRCTTAGTWRGDSNRGSLGTIASASTTDLSTLTTENATVTGTTTITAFGTASNGTFRMLVFAGALTLTHNATSLKLKNNGSNRTTAAGDVLGVVSRGSGNWEEVFFSPAAGLGFTPTASNALSKSVVNHVITQNATIVTCNTTIPRDNTIPTNTEGTAYTQLDTAITPNNASNTLVIRVKINGQHNAGANTSFTLFQDSGTSALCTAIIWSGASGDVQQGYMVYKMAAGTTSSTTFKLRVGPTSGTFYANGDSAGGGLFGGTYFSTMEIMEIKA